MRLEKRSPSMDIAAMVAPVLQSRCNRTAAPDVQRTDRMTPRKVFEAPKRGSLSGRIKPQSSGKRKRSWSSFVAKIGVPLATPRSASSCRLSIQLAMPLATSEPFVTKRGSRRRLFRNSCKFDGGINRGEEHAEQRRCFKASGWGGQQEVPTGISPGAGGIQTV